MNNRLWEKLSARERRLALAVLLLAVASVAAFSTTRALARLRDLDLLIDRLEQELLVYKTQEAQGVSVDRAFAEVAAEHSSAWTKAEIHHRLRKEIYRLAAEDPDAPPGQGGSLVEIPSLGQGTLKEGGEGYREYQLSIRIPQTDIYSLIIFIVRLMQSPQSLRVDGLELSRPPGSEILSATVTVTRTIVDGTPPPAEEGEPAEASLANWDGSEIGGWQAQGAELAIVSEVKDLVPEGGACLRAQATAPEALVYWPAALEGGRTYELALDVTAMGTVEFRIVDETTGQPFEDAQPLIADEKTHRYRMLFTVPGDPGGNVALHVPSLRIEAAGGEVFLDNLAISRLAE